MKDTTDTTEKKKAKDLFAETKIRMMMDIYKVSRRKAIEMIAARDAEKAVPAESAPEESQQELRFLRNTHKRIIDAKDFFGEI